MREIKFRSYNSNDKCFYYFVNGGYFNSKGEVEDIWKFDWENAEQYIGPHDKERYEGNIFKSQVLLSPNGISSAHNISYWFDVYCVIVFKNSSFIGGWKMPKCKKGEYIFSERTGFTTLSENDTDIGNIHENPELLK